MGLSMPESNTIAVDYGTDMHKAFPYCYREDIDCVDEASRAFEESWDERIHGEEDKKRNKHRARASLAEFHRVHKPSVCPYTFLPLANEIKADTADIVSPNELPFVVDIGADLPLAGRMDAVVTMKRNGDIWALDYKTASEISARYFANFENACATVGYTLAAKTILSSEADKIQGLIIEAVRVSPKNDESQAYHAFVNAQQIKLFIEHAKHVAKEIIKSNETGNWRQNVSACSPYSMFGQPGRFCDFKDLCLIGDWKEMVKFYKRSEPFHPFKLKA
jgi:hypothetical protein